MAARLAGLIQHLGWAEIIAEKGEDSSSDESEVSSIFTDRPQRGVTLLSHSKYVGVNWDLGVSNNFFHS